MLRNLLKRTMAVVKRYERFKRKSTDTADDRVDTAMLKLFDGSRTWDPTRVDLAGFLLGVVTSDLTSEMRRAKKAPQLPLEDQKRTREDDYTGEACDESSADSRASFENGWRVPLAPESRHAAWYVAMKNLHERAAAVGDAGVLALLGAYEEGVTQKRDVIALLKWTPATYKRVYQRLLDLADTIDPTVREAIVHALVN
jgi:DNA-directed RNA polymerase specialized sigma24 family protein